MKIYILSQGGLGNQLFQANYAHYLSTILPSAKIVFINHNIALDRDFALNGFFAECSHLKEASKFDTKTDFIVRTSKSLSRRFPRLSKYISKGLGVVEAVDAFDGTYATIERLKKMRFLPITLRIIGHFQNSNFVNPDICFKKSLISFVNENTSSAAAESSGVIHLRQGDYFQNASMGPISTDYFKEVVNGIHNKVNNFIIHTDGILDKSWIPSGLQFSYSEDSTAIDVLYDASRSSIFVGSNSSLSWWASYMQSILNSSAVSIFPSEWMRGLPTSQSPICRKSWILHKVIWI